MIYFLNRNTAKEAVNLAFDKSIESLKSYEFIKAGNELKSAFSNIKELVADGYLVYLFVERLFDEEFLKQETAFLKFSAYLTDSPRDEFRKAWQEYKSGDKDDFIGEYAIVEDGSNEDENRNKESRQRILSRIDKVLEFTDV